MVMYGRAGFCSAIHFLRIFEEGIQLKLEGVRQAARPGECFGCFVKEERYVSQSDHSFA